jgi:hypothetical protein
MLNAKNIPKYIPSSYKVLLTNHYLFDNKQINIISICSSKVLYP